MFTLGDVSDVLDTALDTGLDIVDVLEKLSEFADEGKLSRQKCFDNLSLTDSSQSSPAPAAAGPVARAEDASSCAAQATSTGETCSSLERQPSGSESCLRRSELEARIVYDSSSEQSERHGYSNSTHRNGSPQSRLDAHIENNNRHENREWDATNKTTAGADCELASCCGEQNSHDHSSGTRLSLSAVKWSQRDAGYHGVINANDSSSTKAEGMLRSSYAMASSEAWKPQVVESTATGFNFQGFHGADIMDALSELCSVADEIIKQDQDTESSSLSYTGARLDLIAEQADTSDLLADDTKQAEANARPSSSYTDTDHKQSTRYSYASAEGNSPPAAPMAYVPVSLAVEDVRDIEVEDICDSGVRKRDGVGRTVATRSSDNLDSSRPSTYVLNKRSKALLTEVDIPLNDDMMGGSDSHLDGFNMEHKYDGAERLRQWRNRRGTYILHPEEQHLPSHKEELVTSMNNTAEPGRAGPHEEDGEGLGSSRKRPGTYLLETGVRHPTQQNEKSNDAEKSLSEKDSGTNKKKPQSNRPGTYVLDVGQERTQTLSCERLSNSKTSIVKQKVDTQGTARKRGGQSKQQKSRPRLHASSAVDPQLRSSKERSASNGDVENKQGGDVRMSPCSGTTSKGQRKRPGTYALNAAESQPCIDKEQDSTLLDVGENGVEQLKRWRNRPGTYVLNAIESPAISKEEISIDLEGLDIEHEGSMPTFVQEGKEQLTRWRNRPGTYVLNIDESDFNSVDVDTVNVDKGVKEKGLSSHGNGGMERSKRWTKRPATYAVHDDEALPSLGIGLLSQSAISDLELARNSRVDSSTASLGSVDNAESTSVSNSDSSCSPRSHFSPETSAFSDDNTTQEDSPISDVHRARSRLDTYVMSLANGDAMPSCGGDSIQSPGRHLETSETAHRNTVLSGTASSASSDRSSRLGRPSTYLLSPSQNNNGVIVDEPSKIVSDPLHASSESKKRSPRGSDSGDKYLPSNIQPLQNHKTSVPVDQWPSALGLQHARIGSTASDRSDEEAWLRSCNSIESFATDAMTPFCQSLDGESDMIASSSFSDDIGVSQIFGCSRTQSELSLEPMKHERTQSYEDISPSKLRVNGSPIHLSASMPNFNLPKGSIMPTENTKLSALSGVCNKSYVVSKSRHVGRSREDVAERLDTLYRYMSMSLSKLHEIQRCQTEVMVYNDDTDDTVDTCNDPHSYETAADRGIPRKNAADGQLPTLHHDAEVPSATHTPESPPDISFDGFSPSNQSLNASPFQLKRTGTYVIDWDGGSDRQTAFPVENQEKLQMPKVPDKKITADKPNRTVNVSRKKSPASSRDKDRQPWSAKLTMLKMKLEEKRKHIESEKRKKEQQWSDQLAEVGRTVFWCAIGNEGDEINGTIDQSHPASAVDVASSLSEISLPAEPSPDVKSPAWEISLEAVGNPQTGPTQVSTESSSGQSRKSPGGLVFVPYDDSEMNANENTLATMEDFIEPRLHSPPTECSTPMTTTSQERYAYPNTKVEEDAANSTVSLFQNDIVSNNIGTSTSATTYDDIILLQTSVDSEVLAAAPCESTFDATSDQQQRATATPKSNHLIDNAALALSLPDSEHKRSTVEDSIIDTVVQHHERKLWGNQDDIGASPVLPKVSSSYVLQHEKSAIEIPAMEDDVVGGGGGTNGDDSGSSEYLFTVSPEKERGTTVPGNLEDSPIGEAVEPTPVPYRPVNSEHTIVAESPQMLAHEQAAIPRPVSVPISGSNMSELQPMMSASVETLNATELPREATPVIADTKSTSKTSDQIPAEVTAVPTGNNGAMMYVAEDNNTGLKMTPEQIEKREHFIRMRQKRMEEEKAKKAAENAKKLRREVKLRERKLNSKQNPTKPPVRADDRNAANSLSKSSTSSAENVDELVGFHPVSHKAQRAAEPPTRMPQSTTSALALRLANDLQQAAGPSQFAEYKGPGVYTKPAGRSNRKITTNAISHCCLPGDVNRPARNACLQELSKSDAVHFFILFRDGLKFRALYSYSPDTEEVTKLYGVGPKQITAEMVEKVYKYNSGAKEFSFFSAKSLSIQVDGLTMKKECWQPVKASSSKTDSNAKLHPPSSRLK